MHFLVARRMRAGVCWSLVSHGTTKPRPQGVGPRIRAARIKAGWNNAAAFADECGIRPVTLWRYERKGMVPGHEVLLKIAEAAQTSKDWLLYGDAPGGVAA